MVKKLYTSATLALISLSMVALPVLAGEAPAPEDQVCEGQECLNISGPAWLPNVTPAALVTFIINAFFALAVLAALIYLLWGGLNWILSGGDKDKVENARQRIIAAIIGLVLVVLAYVILNFVLVLLGLGGIAQLELPTLVEPGTEIYPENP